MKKFINTLLLSVLSICLVIGSSLAMQDNCSNENIASRYINFLNRVGSSNGQEAFQAMESLFSPSCHKIINGETTCKNIEELQGQLTQAQHEFKKWTVKPYENNCILFPENNTYVLQFEVGNDTTNLIVIKYITFDDNGLITNINEVYNTKIDDVFSVERQESKTCPLYDSQFLKNAGQGYVKFLQSLGEAEDDKLLWKMNETFTPTCLNVANGGIVSHGINCQALFKAGLSDLLRAAKEEFGYWTIELDQDGVIANAEENVCMVRYNLKPSESQTTYTFIAYLRFGENGKIQKIDAVYSQSKS